MVQKVLDLQSKNGATDFSMLLTFKAKEALRGSKEIFDYWKGKNLENFSKLESAISGSSPAAKTCRVVSMIALHIGHISSFLKLKSCLFAPPIVYRGNHGIDGYQKKKTQMVAMGFRIEKVTGNNLSKPKKFEREINTCQDATIEKLLTIGKIKVKKI
jgi:hypothetical protein